MPGGNDPDAIKAEIEATRAQLARTVDELSHRLDVPARAKEGAFRARDTAVETYRENPPVVLAAALALAGAVVGLVVWRRKRAHPRRNKR
jgi:HAMP domain-containing protein